MPYRKKVLKRGLGLLPVTLRKRLIGSAWKFGEIISLGTGEPGFDVPEHIKKATKKALDEGIHYSSPEGLNELREAIANRTKRDYDLNYDPDDEITITYGASEALSSVLLTFVELGDEVLLSDPAYFVYEDQILQAGGRPVRFPLREQNCFRYASEEIEHFVTPRTKMVIINSPCNPTGTVLTRNEVEDIARIAIENNLLLVWDEVYEKILFDDAKHYNIASIPEMRKRTIAINSFSKTYAMTGWRVGYIYADAKITKKLRYVHRNLVSSMNAATQLGALAALKGPQHFISKAVQEYRKRRDLLVKGLNEIEGVECVMPKGTFFAFPNFSSFKLSSTELAGYLREKGKTDTAPGVLFGPSGDNYLRLSYGYADDKMIKEALYRIRKAVNDLHK